jgi:bifunctional non-homologous end joining protein LigD
MTFYAFDLLYLGGADLRMLPQTERKLRLKKVLKKIPGITYSEHHTEGAKEMLAQACELNLEGLIAKRPDAPYRSDRNENWLKLKCVQTDQFIIVGYVPASSGRGLGALRLATKDLQYAGKVGTGFSDKVSISLRKQLDLISIPKAPIKIPRKRDTTWVEPKLQVKVAYRDITDDGMLRHASFKGMA